MKEFKIISVQKYPCILYSFNDSRDRGVIVSKNSSRPFPAIVMASSGDRMAG